MDRTTSSDKATLRIRGHEVEVRSLMVEKKDLVVTGHLCRIVQLRDEWYQELGDPSGFIDLLLAQGVTGDLFTFIQRPPDCAPRFPYHMEWDNVAAIGLESYEHWWQEQIGSKTRALVRKAAKSGVVVKALEFDDELVKGIEGIYNETPVRQGKRFWHYKKNFEYLKKAHETYLDQSDFIGAFFDKELVGFIKLVYAGETGNLMQIVSKLAHRDKAVTNALIAKAVEICCDRGAKYLVYDKYDYGIGGSPTLLLFKQNSGFLKLEFPRYFVPLTARGALALKLNIHHGLIQLLPRSLLGRIVDLRNSARARWYAYKYGKK